MGDRRYDASYDALASASDRPARLKAMRDEEVVHALAAASRKMDAYLANVLAVEVLRRRRRQQAAFWGAVVGLSSAILARTTIFLFQRPDTGLVLASTLATLPCVAIGYATYRLLLRRPFDGARRPRDGRL